MIRAYNLKQAGKAILAAILCLVATALTFFVAKFIWEYVFNAFQHKEMLQYSAWFGGGFLVVAWISTWSFWLRGFGQGDLSELGMIDGLGHGGGLHFEFVGFIGGTHLLTQLALSSPLQGLRMVDLLCSKVPDSPDVEQSLDQLLGEVRENGKWHKIAEYPGRETELSYLTRMRKIDFSAHRGRIRIVSAA